MDSSYFYSGYVYLFFSLLNGQLLDFKMHYALLSADRSQVQLLYPSELRKICGPSDLDSLQNFNAFFLLSRYTLPPSLTEIRLVGFVQSRQPNKQTERQTNRIETITPLADVNMILPYISDEHAI